MHLSRILLAAAAACVVAGCSRDTNGVTTVLPPAAFVRFVNLVPDTGAVDFRTIDGVVDSPSFFGATTPSGAPVIGNGADFRQASPYMRMGAGNRHVRVFMHGTTAAIASTIIFDTTAAFTADTYYTLAITGNSRTGASPAFRGVIITDNFVAPAAGQFGIRVYHGAPSIGAVDIFARVPASPANPLGTALFTNVTFRTATNYVSLPLAAQLNLVATATGTTTPVIAEATLPVGVAPTNTTTGIGGSSIAGSVLTAILVSPSVAGSQAATFGTASFVYLVDRRPPMLP
ncbi:MAG: DUF4397 domain-containing protein [Gemmatimonadota bacterium]|nr:DUF4397 domain-containing protein [Gemmatimonadota bacterium]